MPKICYTSGLANFTKKKNKLREKTNKLPPNVQTIETLRIFFFNETYSYKINKLYVCVCVEK